MGYVNFFPKSDMGYSNVVFGEKPEPESSVAQKKFHIKSDEFDSKDYTSLINENNINHIEFTGDFKSINIEFLNDVSLIFNSINVGNLVISCCSMYSLSINDSKINNSRIKLFNSDYVNFFNSAITYFEMNKTMVNELYSFKDCSLGGYISSSFINRVESIENELSLEFHHTNFKNGCFVKNKFLSGNENCLHFYKCSLTSVNFENNFLNEEVIEDFENNDIFSYCVGLESRVPSEGSFIGWKALRQTPYTSTSLICKLLILEDSDRVNSTTTKCRCSKAKVLEIMDCNGKPFDFGYSSYDTSFIYRVGEIVEVKCFDKKKTIECTRGIHFFIDKKEAITYSRYI